MAALSGPPTPARPPRAPPAPASPPPAAPGSASLAQRQVVAIGADRAIAVAGQSGQPAFLAKVRHVMGKGRADVPPPERRRAPQGSLRAPHGGRDDEVAIRRPGDVRPDRRATESSWRRRSPAVDARVAAATCASSRSAKARRRSACHALSGSARAARRSAIARRASIGPARAHAVLADGVARPHLVLVARRERPAELLLERTGGGARVG